MTIHINVAAITRAAARQGIFGSVAIFNHLGVDIEGDVTPEVGARVCLAFGIPFAEAMRSDEGAAPPGHAAMAT